MLKNRHIKSKRKRTWADLRVEIKKICEELSISIEEFSEVNIKQWKEIGDKVWARFSSNQNSRWIWETLVDSYSTMPVAYGAFKLEEFIDSTEEVWFLLDETVNEQTKFWIYEGTTNAFNKIFMESGCIDEVLIVSKKYEWILIINHHDLMIGTGILKGRIEKLKSVNDL